MSNKRNVMYDTALMMTKLHSLLPNAVVASMLYHTTPTTGKGVPIGHITIAASLHTKDRSKLFGYPAEFRIMVKEDQVRAEFVDVDMGNPSIYVLENNEKSAEDIAEGYARLWVKTVREAYYRGRARAYPWTDHMRATQSTELDNV